MAVSIKIADFRHVMYNLIRWFLCVYTEDGGGRCLRNVATLFGMTLDIFLLLSHRSLTYLLHVAESFLRS